MSFACLVFRSAVYHWRTNLAVTLGVAAAVAVLGGALLVGDSVRGSLREIALGRLGRTAHTVSSTGYVREALAADLAARLSADAAPIIATRALVEHEPSGRRAAGVLVYGVDERFWQFHGRGVREGVLVSSALAAELGVGHGDALLARVQRPSEIPLESLFAHKEDVARTLRLTAAGTVARSDLGEFTLQPQQAEVRAVFAPLARLQRELGVPGQVNTVLLPDGVERSAAERAFRAAVTLEDLGVEVELAGTGDAVVVESATGIVSESLEAAARAAGEALGLLPRPVFTYLANTIRSGPREVPYSLVSGLDLDALPAAFDRGAPASRGAGASPPGASPIVLNDWTARELEVAPGDPVEIEYYLWDAAAGLTTSGASFTVSAIVPIAGLAADRTLAPEYPGITGAESLASWDPPFPLDLGRVRPQDERYWDEYGATPKGFVPYDRAREMWSTRYGRMTALRFPVGAAGDAAAIAASLRDRLQADLEPAAEGLALVPVRALALEASAGATNFGEYFTYFSFFIVVSAVLLTVLFFRLGVEGRLRQVGILRAAGYTVAQIRGVLLAEAALLSAAGSLLGAAGAIAYAHVIIHGLRTWWVGAVGTTMLEVHVAGSSLAAGAAGGVATALACVWLSVRAAARQSPRALLGASSLEAPAGVDPHRARRSARRSAAFALFGAALLGVGFARADLQAGAFFGAGAALLGAVLLSLSAWLRGRDRRAIAGRGVRAVTRLGFRSAAFRPSRSVLSAALVATAAFIIVSVDAFRRGPSQLTSDPRSGSGGYTLLAESEVPLLHTPNDEAGREALFLAGPGLEGVRFDRFRLRPGEDASCLNLYRPANPAIVAPEEPFLDAGRFSFSRSLAETPEENANPWLLLRREFDDGAVPVVADATSLQYVLHASLGDTMSIDVGSEHPLTLRFVGALRDSVLQGVLVMGEDQFVRHFPGQHGYRFFLIDAPGVGTRDEAAALAEIVERQLGPFGVDAVSTADRLDAFHRVENTYLSTFQALGGLGLLLGTAGLATVMFRNVLERRRELALLRAVGYQGRDLGVMILAETLFLVLCGVAAGFGCALVAIAPALVERGQMAPGAGLLWLLAGVVAAGVLSALGATRAAMRGEILQALRAE